MWLGVDCILAVVVVNGKVSERDRRQPIPPGPVPEATGG